MKKVGCLLIGMLLACLCVHATEATLVCEINRKGEILLPGADRMLDFKGIELDRFVGFAFDKNNAMLRLEPLNENVLVKSHTFVVTAASTTLPARGECYMLVMRPGYHNSLCIDWQGHLSYSIWYTTEDGKTKEAKVVSTRKINPGKGSMFRAAATMDAEDGKTIKIALYMDGQLEGETVVDGTPFKYNKMFFIGSHPETIPGKKNFRFDGTIQACYIYGGLLTPEEIREKR